MSYITAGNNYVIQFSIPPVAWNNAKERTLSLEGQSYFEMRFPMISEVV